MSNFREELLKELRQEGADEKKSAELLRVAFDLTDFSTIRRSYEFKKRFLEKLPVKKEKKLFFGFPRFFVPAFAALILLLISSTVVMAQKSLPGESLYSVKRLSEKLVVIIKPELKDEIDQRRIEENKIIEKNEAFNEKQTKDEKKDEKKKDSEENKNNANSIDEIKNSSESPKDKVPEEKIKENKKEEVKDAEKNKENENKDNNVKGIQDKKVEPDRKEEKKE